MLLKNKNLIGAIIVFIIAMGIMVVSYLQYQENVIVEYCIDKCGVNSTNLIYGSTPQKISCFNKCRIDYDVQS